MSGPLAEWFAQAYADLLLLARSRLARADAPISAPTPVSAEPANVLMTDAGP